MKALILGAKGNLGTQLAKSFSEYNLILWDREDLDFLDKGELLARLGVASPEVVINAAAYNAVDKCEEDDAEKDLAYRLNRDLPANLADWCLANRAKLVHYSSDYVFAGSEQEPSFSEDKQTAPINVYGQSKAAGEAAMLVRMENGLSAYLIRTSKLFGPAGSSPFAKPSFFDTMRRLAQEKGSVEVVDGEMSCFTYTPDLAAATRNLVEEAEPGIYHLVNDGPATWYGGAQAMFDILSQEGMAKPVSPETFVRPAKRPSFSILENNKRPHLRDFREALRDYLYQ